MASPRRSAPSRRRRGGGWGRIKVPDLDQHQATLGLFLLHQRFVAVRQSYFYEYISLLLQCHDAPEQYTEAELSLLNGSAMRGKALRRRAAIKAQHAWLEANGFRHNTPRTTIGGG